MSGPDHPLSTRRALRRATSDAHRRLDDLVTARDPFASLGAYREFLACHWSARTRLRKLLGGLGPDDRWAELQWRDDRALGQDLAALGANGSAPQPLTDRTSAVASADVGRGVLYVLEGSKLGARVLRDQLNERLGEQTPQSFLATGDPQRWTEACQELEASQDCAVVIDAAALSFEVFAESFASRPVSA